MSVGGRTTDKASGCIVPESAVNEQPHSFPEAIEKLKTFLDHNTSKLMNTAAAIQNFAVATGLAFGLSPEGRLTIIHLGSWTAEVRKLARSLDFLTISDNGHTLFTKADDHLLLAFSVPELVLLDQIDCMPAVTAMHWGSSNTLHLVNLELGELEKIGWSAEEKRFRKVSRSSVQSVKGCIFSHNSKYSAFYDEQQLYVADESGTVVHQMHCRNGPAAWAFSPKGTLFAYSKPQERSTLTIIKTDTFTELCTLAQDMVEIHSAVFTVDDCYCLASLNDGKVKIWDLNMPSRTTVVVVQPENIGSLWADSAYIYTTSGDGFTFSRTPFPKLQADQIVTLDRPILYAAVGTDQSGLFFDGVSVVQITNGDLIQYRAPEFTQVFAVAVSEDDYLVSANTRKGSGIFVCENLTWEIRCTLVELDYPASCLAIHKHNILIGDQAGRVRMCSKSGTVCGEDFQGHRSDVTCIAIAGKHNLVIAGAFDGHLIVWDAETTAKKLEARHDTTVNDLVISPDEQFAFSASRDESIKVWSLQDFTLVTQLASCSGSVNSIAVTGQYLYSMTESSIVSLWCLTTYSRVYSEQHEGYTQLLMPQSEDHMLLVGKNCIKRIANPLKDDRVTVKGVPCPSKFYLYLQQLLGSQTQLPPRPELDSAILFPYVITPIHLFVYLGDMKSLSQSMALSSPYLRTSFGATPFTLSLEGMREESLSLLISGLKHRVRQTPHIMSSLNLNTLMKLNKSSHPDLHKLYKLMMTSLDSGSGLNYVNTRTKLPAFAELDHHADSAYALPLADRGQSVVLSKSLTKLPFFLFEKKGRAFLVSLVQSKNEKIFSAPIIQHFLARHWRWSARLQTVLFLLFVVYWVNFTLVFLEVQEFSSSGVVAIYTMMMTLYYGLMVLFQGKTLRKDFWIFCEVFRIAAIYLCLCTEGSVYELFLNIAAMFTFIRGVAYFRLFESARYITSLLAVTIKDSVGFLLILSFTVINFAVFMNSSDEDSYQDALPALVEAVFPAKVWQHWTLQDFDAYLHEVVTATMALIVAILVPIILLNLLISIISDTHDKIQTHRDRIKYKEQASALLELIIIGSPIIAVFPVIKRLSNWHRNRSKSKFLQVCESKAESRDADKWKGRVKEITTALYKQNLKLKSISNQLYQVLNTEQSANTPSSST